MAPQFRAVQGIFQRLLQQGIAMLSSVLNSPTGIEVNIQTIRVLSKMRELLLTNKDILLKHEQIEKIMQQDSKMNQYGEI